MNEANFKLMILGCTALILISILIGCFDSRQTIQAYDPPMKYPADPNESTRNALATLQKPLETTIELEKKDKIVWIRTIYSHGIKISETEGTGVLKVNGLWAKFTSFRDEATGLEHNMYFDGDVMYYTRQVIIKAQLFKLPPPTQN
jgi:hypothetical protein